MTATHRTQQVVHDGVQFEQPLLTSGPSSSPHSQRWLCGQPKVRYKNVTSFYPRHYEVAPISQGEARTFVREHHYLGSCSQITLAFGLFDIRKYGRELVGVAVFGNAMHPNVLTNAFPDLTPCSESVELSRFVLHDDVPANAESWMIERILRDLWRLNVLGVVAFSDPVAQMTPDGAIILGHIGTIYQATNAIYTGQTRPQTRVMLPDGRVITARSLSKVRNGERGARGVIETLVSAGASEPLDEASMRGWLECALRDVNAAKVIHPGTHRYLFPIGNPKKRGRDRQYPRIGLTAYPYSKRPINEDLHLAVQPYAMQNIKASATEPLLELF